MKKVAEFTGKKVQDAVEEGLKALGITYDDAEIKIISNGGLFKKAKVAIHYEAPDEEEVQKPEAAADSGNAGHKDNASKDFGDEHKKRKEEKAPVAPDGEPHWGGAPVKREPTTAPGFGKPKAEKTDKPEKKGKPTDTAANKPDAVLKEKPAAKDKPAKKEQTRNSVLPTEEQIATAKEFMDGLLERMNIAGSAEITVDEGMRVNIDTEDSRIIGHRGEVLDSIQQLISSLINTSHGNFVHITVDGLGYRDRRKESLESLARRMADKAVRTHRKVALDAMNSGDRRIIHAALGERDDVFTRSEGHEPGRRVVIVPKKSR